MNLSIGFRPDRTHKNPADVRARLTRFSLAAVLFLATAAGAQLRTPLTLAETEDLALANEPGQLALEARAAALRDRAVIAGELPDPTLRVGLNNYPIQSGNFTTEGMTNAGLAIRQAFPAGKTRSISSTRYESLAGGVARSADARGRDVLMSARIGWLDAYFWAQSHELVNESRPFFADLATIARSLYAVGRKNQQDVLRAELELSRIDDRLIEIQREQARTRAVLGEWIGDVAHRPPAQKLPQWNDVPPLQDLRDNLQAHPTLLAADSQVAAMDAGVDLADQRSKPQWALDLAYSYRDGSLPNGDPRSDFVTLGVTVGLPFFRKKSVDSTMSAALAELSAAESSRLRMERELVSRLAAEYSRWQDLSRRLALYEERILGQANDHAQATLLAYQNDRGDFADVMRGYIDDLNTRIEYVRLQVERAKSYAALANLGGIPR
jgi:outer membrane protein TolC